MGAQFSNKQDSFLDDCGCYLDWLYVHLIHVAQVQNLLFQLTSIGYARYSVVAYDLECIETHHRSRSTVNSHMSTYGNGVPSLWDV